eukprot:superscaffoldBa00010320_g24647
MSHPYVRSQEGLLCLPAQSQEHGGDIRRPAVTQGELDRAVDGHQPSSRTGGEILRASVRPYAGGVGPGFLLVKDNARPHVARACRQFLDDEGIDAIDWPSRFPDLNPSKHLWDVMYQRIRCCQVPLQTVQELPDALIQVWEEIPHDTIC